MPDSWRCAHCRTLNLPVAEACRRCGATYGAVVARASSHRSARRDSAGLAAVLSLLLPGLGQLYTGRVARAVLALLAPLAVAALLVGSLLAADPLLAVALRIAVGLAATAVALLALYHTAVVLDAFAAPSTRGAGLHGKRGGDYLALGAALVVLGVLYVTLFRQTTAWAGVAQRVFQPFQMRGVDAQAEAWSGDERLNVLLLGIDTRGGSAVVTRNTDTVLVVTVDPLNRVAGMLSIPRDTLVTIPGFGEDKINAVFALGGPDLARRTVSEFLGVPIHSYGLVDFMGFRRIVDAVGGAVVDAPAPLRDEAYPTEDFGVTRLGIRAGPQLMDGETALRYSRARHTSNDFSRSERQQRVLAALKKSAAQRGTLLQVPALVDDLADAVRTDFDPGNALPLLRLALAIDTTDLDRRVLRPAANGDAGQLREVNGTAGYYLVPIRSAVDELVGELFYDPRVRAEAASVELRVSTARSSLAEELRDELARRQYRVARVSASAVPGRTTVIVRNPAKRYTAERLAQVLGASVTQSALDSDADVVAVLGNDYRGLVTRR